jgi:anti-sigma factor RsiW
MSDREHNTHLRESVVDRYVELDLSGTERTEADTHLRDCPSCRTRVSEYRAFFEELGNLPVPEPPPGFAVRILDAVRPSEEALLMRFATRAYAAVAVALAAIAAGVLGTAGPGPVAGTAATGFSRILSDAVSSAQSLLGGSIDLLKAVFELAPVARVMGSLARGMETVALSLAPQYFVVTALTLLLATFVLVWATTARERGVPHVSLSL